MTSKLGFSLLAVAALTALSAPSAFAAGETVLCKVNEGATCVFGNQYAAGTTFKLAATNFKFTMSGGAGTKIACTNALITNKTKERSGNPLKGEITLMTFEPCTEEAGGSSCSVTMLDLPYRSQIEIGAMAPDGTMEVFAHEGGKDPRFRISCFSAALKCVYGETPKLSIHGANPAELFTTKTSLQLLFKEGEQNCGETATWLATYFAKEPTAVFVSKN